jgi:hypothetical protein
LTLIEQLGGEEAFKSQMEALAITEDSLRENMKNELLIRQLLSDETEIDSVTVSQEEVVAAYEAIVGDAEDAPPLDQVQDILQAQLVNQKSGEVVSAYIETLRSVATIERSL